jgi:hypothetical protein
MRKTILKEMIESSVLKQENDENIKFFEEAKKEFEAKLKERGIELVSTIADGLEISQFFVCKSKTTENFNIANCIPWQERVGVCIDTEDIDTETNKVDDMEIPDIFIDDNYKIDSIDLFYLKYNIDEIHNKY